MSFIADVLSFLNGFRKLTVMLLLIIIGVAFRLSNHLNGAEFVDLLKHTAIAYMSFNGLEHMTNAAKEFIERKYKK
jgi:ABC-type amino acid transport system permease subunit